MSTPDLPRGSERTYQQLVRADEHTQGRRILRLPPRREGEHSTVVTRLDYANGKSGRRDFCAGQPCDKSGLGEGSFEHSTEGVVE